MLENLDILEKFDNALIECLTKLNLFSNGGQKCDNVDGPCSCGAWHNRVNMVKKMENYFLYDRRKIDV